MVGISGAKWATHLRCYRGKQAGAVSLAVGNTGKKVSPRKASNEATVQTAISWRCRQKVCLASDTHSMKEDSEEEATDRHAAVSFSSLDL